MYSLLVKGPRAGQERVHMDVASEVEPVELSLEGPVARLTLRHPERRNALGVSVLEGLERAVLRLRRAGDVRVVVLTGEGPCFSAGADLHERSQPAPPAERRAVAERWQDLFDDLERLPQTTVAVLHGAAIGGGLLLAMSCDLRLAARNLVVRMPEVSLGGAPGGAAIPRLVREIGVARARDLVLTGRRLGAEEACAWGLVTRIVDDDDIPTAVGNLLAGLLGGPPDGLRIACRALRAAAQTTGVRALGWADAELASYRQTSADGGGGPHGGTERAHRDSKDSL